MARPSRSAKRWLVLRVLGVAPLVIIGVWRTNNARIPQITVPPFPSSNGYDSYVVAVKQFKTISNLLEADLTHADRGEKTFAFPAAQLPHLLASSLHANQRAFTTLRQGLAYSYRQPAQRSYLDTKERKYWSRCRALARLLVWESRAKIRSGDTRGAA